MAQIKADQDLYHERGIISKVEIIIEIEIYIFCLFLFSRNEKLPHKCRVNSVRNNVIVFREKKKKTGFPVG